ncbi:hypothetical protein I35_4216 [Burkholderia cenocepacia H111]|nr:hypothetical protein I35_4216 [Burkholderia cenocepacia H111]
MHTAGRGGIADGHTEVAGYARAAAECGRISPGCERSASQRHGRSPSRSRASTDGSRARICHTRVRPERERVGRVGGDGRCRAHRHGIGGACTDIRAVANRQAALCGGHGRRADGGRIDRTGGSLGAYTERQTPSGGCYRACTERRGAPGGGLAVVADGCRIVGGRGGRRTVRDRIASRRGAAIEPAVDTDGTHRADCVGFGPLALAGCVDRTARPVFRRAHFRGSRAADCSAAERDRDQCLSRDARRALRTRLRRLGCRRPRLGRCVPDAAIGLVHGPYSFQFVRS